MAVCTTSVLNILAALKQTPLEKSPQEFDKLIDAWNNLCVQSARQEDDPLRFDDIEIAAIAALSSTQNTTRLGNIGKETSGMLGSFGYPAYMVTREGQVAALNKVANQEFDLNIGDDIDLLPFVFDQSKAISTSVKKRIRTYDQTGRGAYIRRAVSEKDGQEVSIAITVSNSRVPVALVFIITPRCKETSMDMLRNEFDLTDTEADILSSFLGGYSSQVIAEQRGRSHATIRTQFQTLLKKTGARTQAELLRIALSVSMFVEELDEIVDVVNHPCRRRAEILRPGGRLVELTLMGEFSGNPILTIANPSNYTFNTDIEQQFCNAGLLIISICPPGCGRTDTSPEGQSRIDCLSQDVEAVLDQLTITRCPVLAYNANTPLCFSMANNIPDRITQMIQVAACVPIRFNSTTETTSPWVSGILKASIDHPAMKRMLFITAMKAWTIMGAKKFMRLQMSSNPVESKHALLQDNITEYEHALETATRIGISAAADDMSLNFEDWTIDVERLPMKITVMHGVQDNLVKIDSVRGYAGSFPRKIRLIEIENAGFPLMQSHTTEVVNLMRSVVGTSKTPL